MGEAFRDGERVGEAFGATKAEVLKKLEEQHPDADEIRIKTLKKQAERTETYTSEDIAKVCHEANRAFCSVLGDDSQVGWSEAPEWQRSSAHGGVKGILTGDIGSPEQAHEAWMAQKKADGWTYGKVKDAANKEHPCMVPYPELPPEQRRKDALFFAIVNALK